MKLKNIFLKLFFSFIINHYSIIQSADFIIFSYNRPMQLYALLEASKEYLSGIGKIFVIYRSDLAFEKGYDIIKRDFSKVIYKKQGIKPSEDFKKLTLEALNEGKSSFILFAADDEIFKDYVDLALCERLIQETESYAFLLRLGTHLKECYMVQKSQNLPELKEVYSEVYSWNFSKGDWDWGYPHNISQTIYRKEDVIAIFKNLKFYSPNTLEGGWALYKPSIDKGLCFKDSKALNVPLNIVQSEAVGNRYGNFFSVEELLKMFLSGKKIDISSYYKIENSAAHMEIIPKFIDLNEIYREALKFFYISSPDYIKAKELFIKLSEQKINLMIKAHADQCLGEMYYKGLCDDKDYVLARKYLKRAVSQNVNQEVKLWAQFFLGKIYLEGFWVNKNIVKAKKYAEKIDCKEVKQALLDEISQKS